MRSGYLSMRQVPPETLVQFSASEAPLHDEIAWNEPLRVSPIFPAVPGEAQPPALEGDVWIGFFVFAKPLHAIARLIRPVDPSVSRYHVWFSHGLASVIVFASSAADLDSVISSAGESGFSAVETWHVIQNRLQTADSRIFAAERAALEPDRFSIGTYGHLSHDTRVLLDEFAMCLHTAARLSAQYSPAHLHVLAALVEAVTEIIDELTFLENPTDKAPPSLPEGTWVEGGTPAVELQRRLHQRVGQLVQINSALSYVISQAFSGTFPLRESECQIRRHSLLGIGTAINALSSLARFVERVFEAYPVDETIDQFYDLAPGIDISPLTITDFNATRWSDEKHHIDYYLERMTTVPSKPKLVFFSGRLGFRESEFAVTAALQVLASADSVRWSLVTLSHELMHAHVRALLSVIFDEPQQGAESSFPRYHDQLKKLMKGQLGAHDLGLRASLRLAILNYCAVRPWINKIAARRATEDEIRLPEYGELREVFVQEFGWINHIFVHVFDYYYFYNANDHVYVRLLWESWSTVPGVLENVEEYLLRTIITISTKEVGSLNDKFARATAIIDEQLKQVLQQQPNNVVVTQALTHLSVENNRRRMLLLYFSASYLGEIAAKLLVSSGVHAALFTDENAEPDANGYRYILESGEFVELEIASPVAFVLDRLRRGMGAEALDVDWEEYRSAWVFLVIASGLK